ncbi:MdtA/MuxA family multidrug efflux RND transporter periplasmic adaptor subunit [Candidatus Nitrotoga fabula]|uniref:MdtA/MuxA family multidrug efflux RND transporter periplasmic adaptor subunit n=1 Tax=Candidatus Nitrotoga fabula TaxID=2182327 RepID=UPI001BB485F3|nr:MdtA/MuxA family multidrug efflux RND transporter periplasmic adaptor subunit [Candidatus Nitrotoga fabula]
MSGILLVAGLAILLFYGTQKKPSPSMGRHGNKENANRLIPVAVATAQSGAIDVIINALGTVTALNTVTVKPRVDGQLVRVAFREGQFVNKGDLLAEIDPRPFQTQLDQANGQLIRDQALLANAKLDLDRYRGLLTKDSIARQQVNTQESLVRQYEGTVKANQALVNNARLQLEFTHVKAPIAGRLGLRLVDNGNMVRTTDTNGLVVITQIQPITVVFSIPSHHLSTLLGRLQTGDPMTVEAWDREDRNRLAVGKLLTVDNQIDTTTGTVKLKAEFTNSDNALFPNQFVNVHLRTETLHGVTLIPVSSTQQGIQGTFLYVVDKRNTVILKPVTLGPVSGNLVAVDKGLVPGEQVVIDGADKLRQGARVEIIRPGRLNAAERGHPKGDAYREQHKAPSGNQGGG